MGPKTNNGGRAGSDWKVVPSVCLLVLRFPRICSGSVVPHTFFFTGEIGWNCRPLDEINVEEQRVLVHVDFNVIFDRRVPAEVTQMARSHMQSAVPTIRYCLNNRAKSVVLVSRLRPPTNPCPWYAQCGQLSLRPLAKALESMIDRPVTFMPQHTGPAAVAYCKDPPHGTVILLEKLPHEETGMTARTSAVFFGQYAKLADVFVNDTFATVDVHRSDVMLGAGFRFKTYGMQIERELRHINEVCPHRCTGGVLTRSSLPFHRR